MKVIYLLNGVMSKYILLPYLLIIIPYFPVKTLKFLGFGGNNIIYFGSW